MITQNQIFLKSSFFSLITLYYLVLIVGCLSMFFNTQSIIFLILSLLAALFILQRLPYQKQILLKEIKVVKLNSVRGVAGRGSLLTISLNGKAINIIPAQILPEEIVQELPHDAS